VIFHQAQPLGRSATLLAISFRELPQVVCNIVADFRFRSEVSLLQANRIDQHCKQHSR
jgi:hypothetical protein